MKITDLEKTIDNFSKYQKEQGKSDNTIKTYVGVLKKFQLWLTTKDITLEQISKNEVQSYIDYLEQQQKNAGTIEKYLAAISILHAF